MRSLALASPYMAWYTVRVHLLRQRRAVSLGTGEPVHLLLPSRGAFVSRERRSVVYLPGNR